MIQKTLFAALGLSLFSPVIFAEDIEPVSGPYAPSWESLSSWECPEWFKDAKFGIWAHWGPQCEPGAGDWYARFMYYPGSGAYNHHVSHYGAPDKFGLKDLCNEWKAQNWNPSELVNLYKDVGAKYFMVLANHHDNMDLYDSPYQEWNSVNIGPKRDIVGEWVKAAKDAGLPLGVSVHASHAWTWLEGSQRYDGNLTKDDGYAPNADGTEKWWKGMDPQELYAQRHEHSTGWENSGTIHSQWDWGNGASLPNKKYRQKLMNRTLQLVNDYKPDMVYFDDTVLPFYGCDDQWGQDFLASYYNASAAEHDGKAQVVVTGKQLPESIKESMLWDVERGIPDRMQQEYWQTCTCIGDWHYNQGVYDGNRYKSGATVIRMLVDVVSKNGNLLLNIPVKGDGTIDDKERKILADIKAWMDINSESIYGTRTWKTFGEGPLADAANPMNAQGFNEGLNYTSSDIRFVQKDGTIYATIMAWPEAGKYTIKSFGAIEPTYSGRVTSVKLLGYGDIPFSQNAAGLTVEIPATHPNEIAPVLSITTDGTTLTDHEKLSQLSSMISTHLDEVRHRTSYFNTGRYNSAALPKIEEALSRASSVSETAGPSEIAKALAELRDAYADFLTNGVIAGGLNSNIKDCEADLTIEKLVEKERFSRETAGSSRFGAPKHWTVENFNIPNGGDGTKQGIDGYTGRDCLMLGVWNDRDAHSGGNLANARIYRTISLPKGLYFFGAAYETNYNLADRAYMFVSPALLSTSDIPAEADAFYKISDCAKSTTQYHGVWFYNDAERDIKLGFQADLATGADTKEFRVDKVVLLKLADISATQLTDLKDEIATYLDNLDQKGQNTGNTGYYARADFDSMRGTLEDASKTPAADYDAILSSYHTLKYAWDSFKRNRLALASPCAEDNFDLTEVRLAEATEFTPTVAGLTSRFGIPKNWIVENFEIHTNSEGIKGGLDKYEGTYALMLGVWDDRAQNKKGNLANARIYRHVYLPAGDYFFGAKYNANHNLKEAYSFVSSTLVDTSEIPGSALSWCNVTDCGKSTAEFKGLHFTVPESAYYYIGWQADLKNGGAEQEFRAETIRLAAHADLSAVEEMAIGQDTENAPEEYYTLQGIRINSPSAPGIYIVRSGSKAIKVRY